MSIFSRTKNRLLALAATRIPTVAKKFIAGYQPQESTGEIPWSRPRKPLHQARLALVTTSGIHHRRQQPFDMQDADGDPSFREINGATIFNDFQITHDYYDHSDARKDPNIIFPLDRINELSEEGIIGSAAATHYSLMGHIDGEHIATLVNKSARQIAAKLKGDQVDLVLLTPA
jgi:D-proline reductase (dithiol) PrdB